jgi:hypothetical protein
MFLDRLREHSLMFGHESNGGRFANEPISKSAAQPTSQRASIGVAGRVPEDLDLRQRPKGEFIHPIVRLLRQHWSVP